MTPERKTLIYLLTKEVQRAKEDKQKAFFAIDSSTRTLAWAAKCIEDHYITEEEAENDLWWNYLDSKENKDSEYDKFVEYAVKFIDNEYKKSKHEGREAKGFFLTLFERIDPKLEAILNAKT